MTHSTGVSGQLRAHVFRSFQRLAGRWFNIIGTLWPALEVTWASFESHLCGASGCPHCYTVQSPNHLTPLFLLVPQLSLPYFYILSWPSMATPQAECICHFLKKIGYYTPNLFVLSKCYYTFICIINILSYYSLSRSLIQCILSNLPPMLPALNPPREQTIVNCAQTGRIILSDHS